MFVLRSSSFRRQVCLCTQATVDHLHWLAETARSWDGPVSVAVFVPGTEMAVAMWAVGLLRRCHAGIRRGVRRVQNWHILQLKIHIFKFNLAYFNIIWHAKKL